MSKPKKSNQDNKRKWAELLYCKENHLQKEIADIVGVTEKTVSGWKNKYKWDELKKSLSQTRQEQLKDLNDQLDEINKNIKTRQEGKRFADSKEADIISKLSKSIKELERDMNISEIIDVSMAILNWQRLRDFKKAQDLSLVFDAYINELLNK